MNGPLLSNGRDIKEWTKNNGDLVVFCHKRLTSVPASNKLTLSKGHKNSPLLYEFLIHSSLLMIIQLCANLKPLWTDNFIPGKRVWKLTLQKSNKFEVHT